MFLGRLRELADLRAEFDRPRASLLIVYGRRRVGKSTLLQQAAAGRRGVYYQATRDFPQASIAAFAAAFRDALGDDGIIGHLTDWFAVLNHLAHVAERTPGMVIMLDEFPYLAEADPALPSVVQKFFDSAAPQRGRLKLVLCGSAVAQMESLLAEKHPLYGRQTGILDIGPLPLREAVGFFPGWSPADAVTAYAIFGGVPYYLEDIDPAASIERNVIDTLLARRGTLAEEPANLLKSETNLSARFFGVLHAIADGCTRSGDIKARAIGSGDDRGISWYLDRLRSMGIVRAERSMDATERERDRRYVIDDPLTAFWFRFVQPYASAIALGFGARVYQERIGPHLAEFMDDAFEAICRAHVRQWAQELLPSPASQVGRIWAGDYAIDIAAELLDGSLLFGDCKWRGQPVGEAVLDHLMTCASRTQRFGAGAAPRNWMLFSKAGYTADLRARADSAPAVHLIGLDALVGGVPDATGRA